MKNLLFPIRNAGHLTCIWVPTGNPKNPLACVWTNCASSHTTATVQSSPSDEVGRMPLCA